MPLTQNIIKPILPYLPLTSYRTRLINPIDVEFVD